MRISVVASADTLLPAASPIIAATNPRSTQSGRRGGGGRSSNFQHRNPQTRQPKGEAASAEQLDAEMDAYMAIDKDNE
ncbi:hypothetical protein H4R35_001164 [Dimargaris xerosporica]|nr:hypothetical protein H4R35_001164 [Dimargaris xerosporica]